MVIQLTGDNRQMIYNFLIEEGICLKDNIKIHGIWIILDKFILI